MIFEASCTREGNRVGVYRTVENDVHGEITLCFDVVLLVEDEG